MVNLIILLILSCAIMIVFDKYSVKRFVVGWLLDGATIMFLSWQHVWFNQMLSKINIFNVLGMMKLSVGDVLQGLLVYSAIVMIIFAPLVSLDEQANCKVSTDDK